MSDCLATKARKHMAIICPYACPCTVETRRHKRSLEVAIEKYMRARKMIGDASKAVQS